MTKNTGGFVRKGLLEQLVDEVEGRAKDVAAVAKGTYDVIKEDVERVVGEKQERFKQAVDNAVKQNYVRQALTTIFKGAGGYIGRTTLRVATGGAKKAAKGGIDDLCTSLRESYDSHQAELDTAAKKNPGAVGLYDGIMNVYLGKPCDRRPKSPAYREGVVYGKVIGVGTSVGAVVTGNLYLVLAGLTPVLSRVVPYVQQKVAEANDKQRS